MYLSIYIPHTYIYIDTAPITGSIEIPAPKKKLSIAVPNTRCDKK